MRWTSACLIAICALAGPQTTGASTLRFQTDGAMCTVQDEYGFPLRTDEEGSIFDGGSSTAAYWTLCPVPLSILLDDDTFEQVAVRMALTGTDADDVVEACLVAVEPTGSGWNDCDCGTHTQAGNPDYFSISSLYYGGAGGSCDTGAGPDWPTQVSLRFTTANGAVNYCQIKRVSAWSI